MRTIQLLGKPNSRECILRLLRSADVGIVDAEVQERIVSEVEAKREIPPVFLATIDEMMAKMTPREGTAQKREYKRTEIHLTHKAEGAEPIGLAFYGEESGGTQRFFALLGPWLDALDNGHTVVIDEIETSLHPLLVRELLKLVFSNETNPKGAQIIFTTHNPILLDTELMRRDMIWFTEKTSGSATRLYPLTDYKPRNNEALARGYLAGRYGAIPDLADGLKL
jgi:predicted ATPase